MWPGGEESVDARSHRRRRGPDLVGGCEAWEEEERMNAGSWVCSLEDRADGLKGGESKGGRLGHQGKDVSYSPSLSAAEAPWQ